jgi:soluble cytochrome b562
MTISGIPPSTNPYSTTPADNRSSFRTSISALEKALKSGDLTAAQSAFATLQQMQPNSQAQSASSGNTPGKDGQNPLASDMQAVAKALQSGDMKAAQTAFAKLQQDMKSVHHGHHRHHHQAKEVQSDAEAKPAASDSVPPTDSSFGVTA